VLHPPDAYSPSAKGNPRLTVLDTSNAFDHASGAPRGRAYAAASPPCHQGRKQQILVALCLRDRQAAIPYDRLHGWIEHLPEQQSKAVRLAIPAAQRHFVVRRPGPSCDDLATMAEIIGNITRDRRLEILDDAETRWRLKQAIKRGHARERAPGKALSRRAVDARLGEDAHRELMHQQSL
jgi:hypothetical protein